MKKQITLILLTVVATLYSFCLRLADNYSSLHFTIVPRLVVQVGYFLLFGMLVNIWFRIRDKSLSCLLIYCIVNMGLAYYLYIYNSITYGIVPIYTALLTTLLLFDFLFSIISIKIKKR